MLLFWTSKKVKNKSKQIEIEKAMRSNTIHTQAQLHPIHLDEEETQKPKIVIARFFDCYRLPDIREQLWDFITGLMSSQEADDFAGRDRINALDFYRDLEIFIEAAWLIHQKQKSKKK